MGWLAIIGQILGLAPSIAGITKQITDTKVALAKNLTDEERVHADERVRSLEAQRDVLIAESKYTNLNVYTRIGFALPIIIVLWKILVWDQALQLGSTPRLGSEVWNLIYLVAGFYFVQSISQIIKR